MTVELELHDVQGNIANAYPRVAFPRARYVFYRVRSADAGRRFILDLLPLVTCGARIVRGQEPKVTSNVSLTYEGLKAVGIPKGALHSFPEAFTMGMKARVDILADDGPSAPQHWDEVWGGEPVHIFVSIYGIDMQELEARYTEVRKRVEANPGVVQVEGHRGREPGRLYPYQEASAVFVNGQATPMEHFGYRDGISNPYFEGCGAPREDLIGNGKPTGLDPATEAGWAPLATGEFILGYADEAMEYPLGPKPWLLGRNGTFLVYRKLHQNVRSFQSYIADVGTKTGNGAEWAAAKFAGRWRNGAPLATFRTEREANDFAAALAAARADRNRRAEYKELSKQLTAFDYTADLEGSGCPLGAHVRRTNPRSALTFGNMTAFQTPGALSDRRRILRRGLPYGETGSPAQDDGDHGIVFMVLGADIERQFEFVQQQWINYGNDFRLGSEKDPLIGNHPREGGRAIVQGDRTAGKPPLFCSGMPRFVETRGGDYFFVPSLTALRMIGEGTIDVT